MNPKPDKIGTLGLKVSIGCPCATLDHQNGAQVTKMQPSSLQNHGFGMAGDTQEQHQNPKAT